ncbi:MULTISPECIES: tetratricopeptide repeat protein, partial [Nostocales]|uniref:Tetratricopeptide repeat protein n=4 Tax=Nostocales TaxID=1161 RepID=A0A8S9T9X2_9CYAN
MTSVTEALQLAIQHHQANCLDQAEQCYRQVLAEQPDRLEALHGLSIVAQQTGQFHYAEELLKAALDFQPNSVKTWFDLGNLHLSQSRFAEAVESYHHALALQPNLVPIYNNLGYALQQMDQWEKAIACYQKALDLQPKCAEAEANLGNALFAQGKLSSDEQTYYAQLNHKLGEIRERAGDLKTAEAYYRQARELAPEEGQYYINLGKIYQQQKDFSQAIAVYREGLKRLNPRYAEAVATYQSPETIPVTPPVTFGEVTVGAYQFPTIPLVANPEKPRPFWSVIIPVYNRIDYLLEALASVLMQWQGEEEMEILVMDNGSTTPLFEMVNSIGGGVIRYYRNPENLGVITNHNIGIALSRGRWIHVLHDDDCVLPGFYSRLQQSLEACPDSIGVACTGFEYINEDGKTIQPGEVVSLYGEHRGIMHSWLSHIGVCGLVTIPAMVVRRTTYERLGGYYPELPEIADWEIFKRFAAFCDWWYEPGILACYREHTQRMSPENMRSGKMARAIRRAIEVSETYLPAEHRIEITAKARHHNFHYCLSRASLPLKAGNLTGALHVLQETLKIDSSPQAVANLFAWLTQDELAPLREEIVSRLFSLPVNSV